MKVDQVLEYVRTYLGRGLGWEHSICLPQEELVNLRRSIGGVNLQFAETEYQENRDHLVHWMSTDNLDAFKKNKKDKVRLKCLEHFGWITEKGVPVSINYNLNSDGFRIDDSYDKEGIVFYGCSHTFGVGLPKEKTFSHIVSKYFDCANFNFGVPGTGLDLAVLHAMFMLRTDVKNPKAIVVLNPPPRRWNFFSGFNIRSCSSNTIKKNPTKEEMYGMEYCSILNDMNNLVQTSKNIVMLQTIAKEMKIPVFIVDSAHEFRKEYRAWGHYEWQIARGNDSFDGISMARDLIHPGAETHKIWADDIIGLIGPSMNTLNFA